MVGLANRVPRKPIASRIPLRCSWHLAAAGRPRALQQIGVNVPWERIPLRDQIRHAYGLVEQEAAA